MASARSDERKRAMLAWAKAVLAAREVIPLEAFDALTEDDGGLLEAVERLVLRADVGTPAPSKVPVRAHERGTSDEPAMPECTTGETESSESEEAADPIEAEANATAEKLRAWRERLREAAETTDELPYESYVLAWLSSDMTEDKRELRSRFAHRLEGVKTGTLQRLSGLMRDITRAITENDTKALANGPKAATEWFGLRLKPDRIRSADFLLASAIKHKQVGAHPEQVNLFLMALSTCDSRFASLDPDVAHDILSRTAFKTTGGRKKIGPVGALAKLAVACGAFDARDVRTFSKVIETCRPKGRQTESS